MKDFLRSVKNGVKNVRQLLTMMQIWAKLWRMKTKIFSGEKAVNQSKKKRLIFLAGNVCAFRNISRLKHFRKGNCYDNDKCFKSSQCQSYNSNIAHQYLKNS